MNNMETRENLLLQKYYDVDEENKIITISLKYDSVTDIVDNSLDSDIYVIKTDVISNVNEHLKNIPAIYKTEVNITITDDTEYDKEKLVESFEDIIEMNHYSLERENKRKWVLTTVLILVGIIILFFNVVAKANSWYGTNETTMNIASEVFDICAWVFVWEAVTVMFLTPTELPFNSNKFKLRVKKVSFYDNKLNEFGTLKFDIKNLKWDSIKRIDVFSHRLFLIGGAMLIGVGFCGLIRNISLIAPGIEEIKGEDDVTLNLIAFFIALAISFLTNIFEIIAGISTLSNYLGRGPFRRRGKYFTYILVFLIAMSLLTLQFNRTDFAENLVTYIIYIIFITGFVLEKVINVIQKRREQQ